MLKTVFLYSTPQHELFSQINSLIASSSKVSIAVGFLTEAGAKLIQTAVKPNPAVLNCLIIGATTFAACDGLDVLLGHGVPRDRLRVYLGHSRATRKGFTKYHPMMHSKVYLFESSTRATAIVGSHNMTAFALAGQNSEASVLIEGDVNEPIFSEIRSHLRSVHANSQEYNPDKRHGYAWWFRKLYEGFSYKILFGDGSKDVEQESNVVAIAVSANGDVPHIGDRIYLEVPQAFRMMNALDQQVHLYVLKQTPSSPYHGLSELGGCTTALQGTVTGSNKDVVQKGSCEWIIQDLQNPILQRTSGSVTPSGGGNDLQAFIEITSTLWERYEYIFEFPKTWEPVYDDSFESRLVGNSGLAAELCEIDSINGQNLPWNLVVDLAPKGEGGNSWGVMKEVSPESGRFIFLSRRRRLLAARHAKVIDDSPDILDPQPVTSTSVDLVASIGGPVWLSAAKWAKDIGQLKPWQRSLAFSLGKIISGGGLPSEKQAIQGARLMIDAVDNGFVHDDLTDGIITALRSIY